MRAKPSYRAESVADDQALEFRLNAKTLEDFVERYPRMLEKIVMAGQLPSVEHAAIILRDAKERRRSYSEWVLMQYGGDALRAVRSALAR